MGYYQAIDFDIGLAPLIPSMFNRSKSHIKALEYAALGIPVIASDEPPYRDFVIDGVTGFLVRREHEWGQRLRDLVNDDAMRESMGVKAREHAAQFSIEKGWRLWEQAYRTLV
jgi:glycosyltransferase involved in cell wall biosynthesis